MFLLRVKLITQGEKRETSTKTCNETMLRDKLRVFVSRISPPLHQVPVVRKADSAIHRINHYPADSVVCFVNTYPLDSDLSGG